MCNYGNIKKKKKEKKDVDEIYLIERMRRQYELKQRPHAKTNPDFKRMVHDAHYRLQMFADMPEK